MSIHARREREYRRRNQLIVDTARRLAESEGWHAVTTRRLAEEIEYSQPVLYSHFQGKEAIVGAVALEGFEELAGTLRAARESADGATAGLRAVIATYLDFARDNPALYSAMFELSSPLAFATAETPLPLIETFGELISAVAAVTPEHDAELAAEVIWGALHGMIVLSRSGRLRPGLEGNRVDLLLARFTPTG
ncbi:TetR/AcrR family transcriptional regulator [Streptomyces sp. NPDC050982]|uniref:TetR/AcrR family transcriptional regulator n=1 Tax=Streptomyces sp. NPDC050982 TaxID=3154746 RepID=UPI0033CD4B8F